MKKIQILFLALLLVIGAFATEISLEKASRIDMNPVGAVNSDGQVVYAGVGGALNIYNVYHKDFPQLVGTIEGHSSKIKSIIVDGDRLYVLWEKEGLEIFDITDYYRPLLLGKFPGYEDDRFESFTAMDIELGIVYVTGAHFLASVDCGNAYDPVLLNYVELNGAPLKLDYHRNKIYLAAGNLGLGGLYSPNPGQFFFIGCQKGVYTTVKAHENLILYGRLDERKPNERAVFGKHLFSFPFQSPTTVKIEDDIIFAGGLTNFAIYRLPENSYDPQLIWNLPDMPTLDCVLREDVVYLANGHKGLSVFLTTNPESPIKIGRLETFDMPRRACIVGNELFVAAGLSGVLRYDISYPEYPILLDKLAQDRLHLVWDVETNDGDIYILGAREGLIENVFVERYSQSGRWLAEYPVAKVSKLDPVGEMVFSGKFCAIALGREGIALMRNENGALIPGYSIIERGVQFCDLIIDDDLLYASDYWGGYHVFDIDGGMPTSVGYIKTSENGGNGIALAGKYLLAADGPNGLSIVDASKPSRLKQVAVYPSTWATDIFIDGDIAYLSDGQGACKIFDISDLPDVELVYELPDNGYWSHVYAANGSIFGIDQFFGIYIYNVLTEQIALTKTKPERPAEPTISAAHPNPFNAEATISFSLPERTDAELCVFDITGRKVITLIEDCLPAGDYNLRWRADDAPSGTYFAVLRTPNSRATEKLLLIK